MQRLCKLLSLLLSFRFEGRVVALVERFNVASDLVVEDHFGAADSAELHTVLLLVLHLENLDLSLALAQELGLVLFAHVLSRSLGHLNLDLPSLVVDLKLVVIVVELVDQLSHQDAGLEHRDEAVCRCLGQGQLFFLQVDDFVTFSDLSHLLVCFQVVRIANFEGFADWVLSIIVLAHFAHLLGPLAILVDLVPLEELLADFCIGSEFAFQPLVAHYICNAQALIRAHREHRSD